MTTTKLQETPGHGLTLMKTANHWSSVSVPLEAFAKSILSSDDGLTTVCYAIHNISDRTRALTRLLS